jgi:hypothetical protein
LGCLKKYWLGYSLGDFFANSSGHPVSTSGSAAAAVRNLIKKLILHLG